MPYGPMAATRHTVTPELKAAIAKKAADMGITDKAEIQKLFDHLFSSKPEDVAVFVVYLATEDASYISGRTFFINGPNVGLYSEPQVISQINREQGFWTLDELIETVPEGLCKSQLVPDTLKQGKITFCNL